MSGVPSNGLRATPPKPQRGEVYWIDFNPARGVEQAGRRPALVIQNDLGNRYSNYTVIAALSTAVAPKPYPFIVSFAVGEANLETAGHVNCAQLTTNDQSRLDSFIGKFGEACMQQIDQALSYQLGLR